MVNIDFNLLIALEALLSERSVTGAARRLGLSVSAMSRTLTRLREATGDRLLLQAGRTLVLTPYAEQLNQQVPALSRDIQAVLRPTDRQCDPATLERSFTIRAGEGFVDLAGAALMKRIHNAAPGVRLNFVPKVDWDAQPLRDGAIDLEIGTVKTTAPEIRTRLLLRDRYIGVCRKGHPVLDAHAMDAATYAAADHVAASRATPVDAALAALGLKRKIMMTVAGYTHAMQVARHSDLLPSSPTRAWATPSSRITRPRTDCKALSCPCRRRLSMSLPSGIHASTGTLPTSGCAMKSSHSARLGIPDSRGDCRVTIAMLDRVGQEGRGVKRFGEMVALRDIAAPRADQAQ